MNLVGVSKGLNKSARTDLTEEQKQIAMSNSFRLFDNTLSEFNIVEAIAFAKTGDFNLNGVISSTFAGWTHALNISTGESFKALRIWITTEFENQECKVTIYDRTCTNIIASTTQIVSYPNKSTMFVFENAITQEMIDDTIFYVAIESINRNQRLGVPVAINITTRCAANNSDLKSKYNTNFNKTWIDAVGSALSYVYPVELIHENEINVMKKDRGLLVKDFKVNTNFYIAKTKMAINVCINTPTSNLRTSPFAGFGALFNKVDGLMFNVVNIPLLKRSATIETESSNKNKWTKIRVEVRQDNSVGTLVAYGETPVNYDDAVLRDVEVCLLDPNTHKPTVITTNMLNQVYFLGYIAYNDGGATIVGECFGIIANYEGHSYYYTSTSRTWQPYFGNPSMGIETYYFDPATLKSMRTYSIRASGGGGSDLSTLESRVEDLEQKAIDLILPSKIYGLVGKEINIYFDNLIIQDADNYHFNVSCAIGVQQNERWTCIPTIAGSTSMTIVVYDKDTTTKVATKSTTIIVKSMSVGNAVNKKCMFIGDSTTAVGVYTQELLNLFNADVMDITLIGTLGTPPNSHEGRSGWRYSLYLTDPTSPFLYNGTYNFMQYMEDNEYTNLDYAFIHLGINDTFSFTDDTLLSEEILEILIRATTMINGIQENDENTKVVLLVPIPPSRYQDSFGASYGSGQTRWRYKRNIMSYVKELLTSFEGLEQSNIYICPINVNLDTVNNMNSETVVVNSRSTKETVRQNNGVHPGISGYNQMADEIYYFLKSFEY